MLVLMLVLPLVLVLMLVLMLDEGSSLGGKPWTLVARSVKNNANRFEHLKETTTAQGGT